MQNLREEYGVEVHNRALRFLSIRLKSRPETTDAATAIDALRAQLRERQDIYEEALEQRMAATAEIEYLDGRLDARVIAMSRELNVLTGGDRSDARYKKLFPVAPTVMMKPVGGDEQSTYVGVIIERIQSDDDLEGLRGHAKPIRQHLDALDKATKTRRALTIAENKALADRRLALEDVRRAYRLMYPRLVLQFPDDAALVESFFATFTRARDAEVEVEVAPAATEAAPS